VRKASLAHLSLANMLRLISLVLVCALLVACGTPAPLKLDAPGEQRLSASDIVDVELSIADRARIDPLIGAFGESKLKVETGAIWQRAFRGDERSAAKLVITKAELRQSVGGAGFTMRCTYVVEARIIFDGRDYPVRAETSRAAAMAVPSAMRQAVELGVADIAHQARAILDIRQRGTR